MKTIFKSTFYSLTLALFAVVLCFAFIGKEIYNREISKEKEAERTL